MQLAPLLVLRVDQVEPLIAGTLSWSSSDPEVAAVDPDGLVTLLKAGRVTIRGIWRDQTGVSYLVIREPSPPPAPPEPTVDLPPPDEPEEEPDPSAPVEAACGPSPADPFADRVVSYQTGERGGFHEEDLPKIVLGPPHGAGNAPGGLDVFSLGLGGRITLEFTDFAACDGPGPDFIVFENVFGGFYEPAKIAVSADGETWHSFPCGSGPDFEGCAGLTPVFADPDRNSIDPTDSESAGGDSFDLADVGLSAARYLRITDADGCSFYQDLAHCTDGVAPGVLGFDLDAVAVVNGTQILY